MKVQNKGFALKIREDEKETGWDQFSKLLKGLFVGSVYFIVKTALGADTERKH